MPRKTSALIALSAIALLPLAGCASADRSPLDYLEGTWACGDGTAGQYNLKAFTATFDGDRAEFHSDDEWTDDILPDFLTVSAKDGQVVIHDPYENKVLLELPEKMPESGTSAQLPYGGGTISTTDHLVATIDGDSFTLTQDKIHGGETVIDAGLCTRQ
jgi:hypothetical protein